MSSCRGPRPARNWAYRSAPQRSRRRGSSVLASASAWAWRSATCSRAVAAAQAAAPRASSDTRPSSTSRRLQLSVSLLLTVQLLCLYLPHPSYLPHGSASFASTRTCCYWTWLHPRPRPRSSRRSACSASPAAGGTRPTSRPARPAASRTEPGRSRSPQAGRGLLRTADAPGGRRTLPCSRWTTGKPAWRRWMSCRYPSAAAGPPRRQVVMERQHQLLLSDACLPEP
mmetsp:Transcript_5206/g.13145  ORF Transcript_5206/g.13145 Transcript_5206/m.13145 type:complete len:227 (+) Transcript_5206:2651-3331(+)